MLDLENKERLGSSRVGNLGPEGYMGLRMVLSEEFQSAPDEVLDEAFWEITRQMTPEEAEGFFSGLKKLGRKAIKFGKKSLPGVIKGATTGFAAGGPFGALFGGLAGGALSGLKSGSRIKLPSQVKTIGKQILGGSSATSQLLNFVQNPKLIQSLLSLASGSAGRKSIAAGKNGSPAPVGAVLSLLGSLANRASIEAAEMQAENAVPAFMHEGIGGFSGDPADPEDQADALLNHLNEENAFSNLWSGGLLEDEDDDLDESAAVGDWLLETGLVETMDDFDEDF